MPGKYNVWDKRTRYVPALPDFLSLCERNYAQLRHLLPQQPLCGAQRQFQLAEQHYYRLTITDVARFTTTVSIVSEGETTAFYQPAFEVRLYHDARVAEVIACQHVKRFKAVYDYPNSDMLLPDEKRQINQLLRDWLKMCISQGYSASEVVFS